MMEFVYALLGGVLGYLFRYWYAPIKVNGKLWKIVEEHQLTIDKYRKLNERLIKQEETLIRQVKEAHAKVQHYIEELKIKPNDKR